MMTLIPCIVLMLLSCTGYPPMESGSWEAVYDSHGFVMRINTDEGGVTRFSLYDVAQQMRWMDIVCDRCGEDQLDVPGAGLLLLQWGSREIAYSGSDQKLSLGAECLRTGDATWVPLSFLEKLGYRIDVSTSTRKIVISDGAAVRRRRAKADSLPPKPSLSFEALKVKLDSGQAWDGEPSPVQKAAFALIDVRTREEYAQGHIPGAVNIPIDALKAAVPSWPKDRLVVVYCLKGARSAQAEVVLRRQGFEQIINFGGIGSWQEDLTKHIPNQDE